MEKHRAPEKDVSGALVRKSQGKSILLRTTPKILFVLLVSGLVVGGGIFFQWYPKQATISQAIELNVNVPTTALATAVEPGLPWRLTIPAIQVDAMVDYVGLTADGAMDVTMNQDNVAWYQLGPRPGEEGSAVIAGHFGPWNNGRGSVFDRLHLLSIGDQIAVEDDQGVKTVFVVRESRRYNPDDDVPEVFGSNDGLAHLNLITCEGEWDSVTKNYSKRLVIFADQLTQ